MTSKGLHRRRALSEFEVIEEYFFVWENQFQASYQNLSPHVFNAFLARTYRGFGFRGMSKDFVCEAMIEGVQHLAGIISLLLDSDIMIFLVACGRLTAQSFQISHSTHPSICPTPLSRRS